MQLTTAKSFSSTEPLGQCSEFWVLGGGGGVERGFLDKFWGVRDRWSSGCRVFGLGMRKRISFGVLRVAAAANVTNRDDSCIKRVVKK